jgi:tripartite-type tricarboxylate transporter receptor subunit TctC
MTSLLEKAFAEAAKLSQDEQDAVARFLLQELEFEREWDKRFAESQSQLDQLAQEALAEHLAGQTRRLNPNKL